MKAIIHKKYGKPSQLELMNIEKPKPKSNEVLIKVKASSINSWDYDLVTGIPRIYRLMFGLFKPKNKVIGIDVSGVVELVGSEVKNLKAGDEVFGDISPVGFGAFAEYVCSPENLLALKPKSMNFEDAASLPHAGVLALQGIECLEKPDKSKHVLINGAGGSTGPIAIQIAKHFGAKVTCVDVSDKFEFLKSLGADECIDYRTDDYTKNKNQYDLIIDLVAHKSIFKYKRALKPNGVFTIVGGKPRRIIQTALIGSLMSKFSSKKLGILMHKPGAENLNKLVQMFNAGIFKAVIDKTYGLEQVPEAIQYLGDGKLQGKLVIKIM